MSLMVSLLFPYFYPYALILCFSVLFSRSSVDLLSFSNHSLNSKKNLKSSCKFFVPFLWFPIPILYGCNTLLNLLIIVVVVVVF